MLRRRYGHGAIGHGEAGYIQAHHKYAIVGLVPKKGGGYLKKRYVVGRARDAHEALTELYRARHDGGHHWYYVVLDLTAKRGKITPTIAEEELRQRQEAGR